MEASTLIKDGDILYNNGTDSLSDIDSVVFAPNGERLGLGPVSVHETGKANVPSTVLHCCYSVEADGSAHHLIHESSNAATEVNIAWSANGKRMVVAEIGPPKPVLYVYNYDGSGKKLTPLPDQNETDP